MPFEMLRAALNDASTRVAAVTSQRAPKAETLKADVDAIVNAEFQAAQTRGRVIDLASVKARAIDQVNQQRVAALRNTFLTARASAQALLKTLDQTQRELLRVRLPEIAPAALTEAELKYEAIGTTGEKMLLEARRTQREMQLLQREQVRTRLAIEFQGVPAGELLAALEQAEVGGDLVTAAYLDPRVERAIVGLKPTAAGASPEERAKSIMESQHAIDVMRERFSRLRESRMSEAERTGYKDLETQAAAVVSAFKNEEQLVQLVERRGSVQAAPTAPAAA